MESRSRELSNLLSAEAQATQVVSLLVIKETENRYVKVDKTAWRKHVIENRQFVGKTPSALYKRVRLTCIIFGKLT